MPTINPISYVNTSLYGQSTAIVVGRSAFQQMLEDDLEGAFFNPNDFTDIIVYTHRTGEVASYSVLINTPYNQVQVIDQISITDSQMKIRIQERKLLRRPVQGDRALIRGIYYTVDNVEPDGIGVVDLEMNRVK